MTARLKRKNLITVILTVAFVLISAILIADGAAAATTGRVNSKDGLNVRSGPGTNYSVLAVIENNTIVKVIEKTGEWYKVEYDGIEGYVNASYLTIYEAITEKTATVNSKIGLNMRSGPGTSYSVVYTLENNTVVTVLEQSGAWCKVKYNGIEGYVSADYLIINDDNEYIYDKEFEEGLTAQGFPESYKPYLRALYASHPQWVFKSHQTNLNWSDVISKESVIGINLVHKSADDTWKSKEPGAFDSSGEYKEFDSGGWIAASEGIIKYYMDPRNFLNEGGVFQFMSHSYDEQTQNKEGLQKLVSGTFLANKFPEAGYDTYSDALIYAGKQSGANPYVLASMILVEQGKDGKGGSISGKVSGYEGYYNYFNVRAYASGGYDAVQYGLLYAKSQGWNSHIKSIIGGATHYAGNYIKNNQNTLYLKKFNVMNGINAVASHQYMTNIGGAASEAFNLKAGYASSDAITFYIPVYKNMPATACALPNGNVEPERFTERLAGYDRYDTSIAIANKYKSSQGIVKFGTVIVASGEDYADALAGSYLAKQKNAPILLVGKDNLSENKIYEYISQNVHTGGQVYILGGEGAVSKKFESLLAEYDVKRLGGATRFDTNIEILTEAGINNSELLVCAGMDFADGLSVSSTGKAILLVDEYITAAQREYLDSLSINNIYIIGGKGAVSSGIESELENWGNTKRVSGDNRYETSIAVANEFFGTDSDSIVLTYGLNFPDGISGGPLAIYMNMPLVLVSQRNFEHASSYVNDADINKVFVLGGSSLISDTMIETILR